MSEAISSGAREAGTTIFEPSASARKSVFRPPMWSKSRKRRIARGRSARFGGNAAANASKSWIIALGVPVDPLLKSTSPAAPRSRRRAKSGGVPVAEGRSVFSRRGAFPLPSTSTEKPQAAISSFSRISSSIFDTTGTTMQPFSARAKNAARLSKPRARSRSRGLSDSRKRRACLMLSFRKRRRGRASGP